MRNVDFNDNMSEEQYKKRLDYALPNLLRKIDTVPQGCYFLYFCNFTFTLVKNNKH